MTTWIVLLRGINVGGHNKVKMADLRTALTNAGYADIATYIQSGNIVLRASAARSELEAEVHALLVTHFDADVAVMALDATELTAALVANPYLSAAEADPKTVHYYFLADFPDPAARDLAAIEAHAVPGEELSLAGRVLYLHAPHGMARCKVAERIPRHVAVPATARNHRTVAALIDLARDV